MALPFEASPPVSGMLKPILMASAAQTADAAIVPATLKAAMCKAALIKYLRNPHMYAYPVTTILHWMARPQPIPPRTVTKKPHCEAQCAPYGNFEQTRWLCELRFDAHRVTIE